ncbi:Branched-chain amino acid transport system II carrier protein, partial [human gut metagenome]
REGINASARYPKNWVTTGDPSSEIKRGILIMDNLSKKDLRLVSLMLFSLFFGAGNLIFPPFLGQSAGTATWISMLGFFITAVGFPV